MAGDNPLSPPLTQSQCSSSRPAKGRSPPRPFPISTSGQREGLCRKPPPPSAPITWKQDAAKKVMFEEEVAKKENAKQAQLDQLKVNRQTRLDQAQKRPEEPKKNGNGWKKFLLAEHAQYHNKEATDQDHVNVELAEVPTTNMFEPPPLTADHTHISSNFVDHAISYASFRPPRNLNPRIATSKIRTNAWSPI